VADDLRATGYSQDQINQYAAEKIAAAQDGLPDNPEPPVEVKLPVEFGESEDDPLTAAEAAAKLSNWRAAAEAARQAELAELVGSQEQAQEAQQPQPEPQQPQPQPQPTPEQAERQKLAAERQWVENLKRIEGVEASWRHNYDQLRAELVAEFPSLRNGPPDPAHVEQLRVQDPARFQRLAQYDAALRDRQQKIAALAQQRNAREQQQAQAAAQERSAARAEQDRAFEQLAAQHIPGWERNHAEVRAQAAKTLEAAGLSQEEIRHLWTGDHSIDAHSSVLQLVLAKAAQWDLAQQRAHQIRQTPVPQVQKPGTYRAPDSGEQSVRDLQARLGRASGREAIRIGAELTR
jgi:hypothetical protein